MADDNILHMPARSPFYSAIRPEPSWERLQEPSSRVTVTNTHISQTHVVIDRFLVGHELRPGEKREMEMVNEEIASFQEQRRSERYYPESDPNQPLMRKPLHPILIEGVGSMLEEARKLRDERAAEAYRQKMEEQEEERAPVRRGRKPRRDLD